jgi:hypothetical protein
MLEQTESGNRKDDRSESTLDEQSALTWFVMPRPSTSLKTGPES